MVADSTRHVVFIKHILKAWDVQDIIKGNDLFEFKKNIYFPFTIFQPSVALYLKRQFLVAVENGWNLSCFKYITIGGSIIEKPLFDKLKVSI